ncbi:MAG: tetratricopeptide repeat protein, partial [Nitrospinaceae bacterium]
TGIRLAMLAVLLIFAGACATTSPADNKLLAQKKFQEAQKAGSLNLKKEKYQTLREAIRLVPKEPIYRVALGNAYFKNLELDKAEKMYLGAIKVDPEFMGTYRQLGRLYVQKSQWDDALFYLNQALSQPNVIDPIQLLNWAAYSHYRKGDLPKAEKAWLKALDIHDSDQIRLNLALVYKEAQRTDLARASLLKALELNPKLLGAHFALGEIYYRSNKLAMAKKHFSEVIQLEPLSEQARVSQEILKRMSAKK